jgi:hypothetical protein
VSESTTERICERAAAEANLVILLSSARAAARAILDEPVVEAPD